MPNDLPGSEIVLEYYSAVSYFFFPIQNAHFGAPLSVRCRVLRHLVDDRHFWAPSDFDVLLTDVSGADLHATVSKHLNSQYLSKATNESDWPLTGVIFERNQRVFVSSVVSSLSSPGYNVAFIVDTGEHTISLRSPHLSYLH
jgi:hypothetical protein